MQFIFTKGLRWRTLVTTYKLCLASLKQFSIISDIANSLRQASNFQLMTLILLAEMQIFLTYFISSSYLIIKVTLATQDGLNLHFVSKQELQFVFMFYYYAIP